ncbi:3-deoxy-D-manno-octulosonic acid transferase [Methylovirgula sp. 4M-Z18]|uniref:3-deoxy-D-manno-octulosonic acid transferase n=1 Tax=Methylovirgula sp. 4M-Z18 TaxID=2293567 RepID=UPI000E2EE1FC|nr:3-deoxy-D-manno-octulosonic acid transferase [Methylovirgula sp. 4M-Z18]RFB78834.1 3-deoxy-D-manno-octulosonic acid transferase [Methylovirgula sp. 4M-Z18]
MIKKHPLLTLYRGATRALSPFAGAFLTWRLAKGKEDRARLKERRGFASAPRPAGNLAWLHGASVGESISLLPLVDQLLARNFFVLVTTGTVTSAEILTQRLPARCLHQFLPLDAPAFVRRFLDHWRPDLALVAESELWPNLVYETNERHIPLVLVNARMSERSLKRWQRLPKLIGALLSRIDLILTQTQDEAARYMRLGAPRVLVSGNMKYDVPPPTADPAKLAELTAAIGDRPVWTAAVTREGEEEICGDAHLRLRERFPELLTIIVPRHSNRGGEINAQLTKLGLNVAARSKNETITPRTHVYLADTMGELGLFYRCSNLVLMGRTFTGFGSNPIEPAKLGCAILHGPEYSNFKEVYETLDAEHGGLMVEDAEELAIALAAFLTDASKLRGTARIAKEVVQHQGGATSRIMHAIEPYLMQMSMELHQ